MTVGEAISDLPSLLPPEGASEAVVPAAGPNGRRPLQLGKTCTPYRPLDIPGPYAQFMRRGAGHNLMHHSLRANLPGGRGAEQSAERALRFWGCGFCAPLAAAQ